MVLHQKFALFLEHAEKYEKNAHTYSFLNLCHRLGVFINCRYLILLAFNT